MTICDQATAGQPTRRPDRTKYLGWADARLGSGFAARIADHDVTDTFVAENCAELKAHQVFSAGVPPELGDGGASYAELCGLLHELARYCNSSALARAMHTHFLAAAVWCGRQGQPAEPLLRRIADEQAVLVRTGAAD